MYYVNLPKSTPELRHEVQRLLFELGYVWACENKPQYHDHWDSYAYGFGPNYGITHEERSPNWYEQHPEEFQRVTFEQLLLMVQAKEAAIRRKYEGRFWVAVPHERLRAPIQKLLKRICSSASIASNAECYSFAVKGYGDFCTKEWYMTSEIDGYGPSREKTIEQMQTMVEELNL